MQYSITFWNTDLLCFESNQFLREVLTRSLLWMKWSLWTLKGLVLICTQLLCNLIACVIPTTLINKTAIWLFPKHSISFSLKSNAYSWQKQGFSQKRFSTPRLMSLFRLLLEPTKQGLDTVRPFVAALPGEESKLWGSGRVGNPGRKWTRVEFFKGSEACRRASRREVWGIGSSHQAGLLSSEATPTRTGCWEGCEKKYGCHGNSAL